MNYNMGVFLSITYESRYAGDFENNVKQNKVLDYIIDNLNNMIWQEEICTKLREVEKQSDALFIILRLFSYDDIEEGNLKSYTRYKKSEEKLVIDIMFTIEDYKDFPEDVMRQKLCDDIFDYISIMLKKYKDRFHDFDANAFIPLLKERISQIKNQVFEDNFYDTESFAMLKQAEEIKNQTI